MEYSLSGCLKRIMGISVQEGIEMRRPIVEIDPGKSPAPVKTKKIQNLTRVLQPAHTLRLRPDPEPVLSETTRPLPLAWYGTTDTGKIRRCNEDNFSVLAFADKALFVVADGMGGHDAGEVASKIAMNAVCRVVQEEHGQSSGLLSLVERAVQQANNEVRQEATRKGSNMGTTLCVALVADDAAFIANVGDSRAYWIEDGSFSQVTTDHSLVAKLVNAGKLTKEEARTHPKANLLFRTIGTDENVAVDTFRVALKKGGTLLLCTDGLWGEVADDDIRKVCATALDVKAMGNRLVELANEQGGKDNITAVAVKVL